jgi:hypothetical protein
VSAVLIQGAGSVLRNNVLDGNCGYEVVEGTADADPLVFEANALFPAFYYDEGTPAPAGDVAGGAHLQGIDAIEALGDMSASGNLDVMCARSADDHLLAGSACIDRGFAAGAPPRDMDREPRDTLPDIGPDEYVP